MPEIPEGAVQACPCVCHGDHPGVEHVRACCPYWDGPLGWHVGESLSHIEARTRRKVAEEIRAIVADDGPYPMDAWRAFKSRHKRLVTGDSVVAVLLAVADEIEGAAHDPR
ncbi:hypothetical protein [Nonomuraea wenchangensis]|uniref:Uncharacterized protein n=1 Tax=Nonomuraea wenchangensis TaxID=568860 RepID=A0A1I0EXI9_9ACTN|nr:hypothetical protein [Nonomuraea wenchangensis]SET50365.1 hypothetical protein SAMN05421811_103249 [Nonomuraea wenchangensis]